MWLGNWKTKHLCSQVVRALLVSRWLLSAPLWGGTRDMQPINKKYSASLLICHHIFHPHTSFYIRQPGTHFCLHGENTRLSRYMDRCVHVSLLLHSTPWGVEQARESFSTSTRGFFAHPGVSFATMPQKNFCKFKRITWDVSAAEQATLLLHLGAAVVFFWQQKSWMSLWDWKNCKSRLNFHVVIFSTGFLTAQQRTHLPTEKTVKAEDITIAKTCSSHQLFKS